MFLCLWSMVLPLWIVKGCPDRLSIESKTINNHSQMLHAGLIIGLLNSPLAETEKSGMHLCRVLYFKSIS